MGGKVRWGVAGCGWVARDFVLPALSAAQNSEVVALLDPDPVALQTAGCLCPGASIHADLDSFLGAPRMEAVYVATPNHLHQPLVEAAARAGKHVICEKPMAASVPEAESMISVCKEAGVVYGTAFDQRFHAAHRKLKTLISTGALGTVCSARIHYACWLPPDWDEDNWRADPERAGGGALVDLAPHGLDLLQYLLEDEISEVRCLTQHRVHDYAVEDGAALAGTTRGGVLMLQHVSYNTPEEYPRRILEIVGTRAMAVATNTLGQTAGGKLEIIHAGNGRREELGLPLAQDLSPFLFQVEAFAAGLLGDEEAFPFEPARDLHTMRLISDALKDAGERLRSAV